MLRIWNALVAATYNALGNGFYNGFFSLISFLYQWGLGAAPALYVDALSATNLAGTYANGTLGVGATLTKASAGAFPTIDGVTPFLGMRVLLAAQTTGLQGGYYQLTRVGSATVAWQLTRATPWDQSAEMVQGTIFLIKTGTTYGGKIWAYTGASSPTVGTTALTFAADSLLRSALVANSLASLGIRIGQVTLVAGTATVADTATTATTKVFLTLAASNTTTLTTAYEHVYASNTAGTSFVVRANVAAGTINVADVSTLNYLAIG